MSDIQRFGAASSREWDAYVDRHPHGTPFHLRAWGRTIGEVFGFASECLVAWSGGNITGVLPLYEVDNFMTGRVLISSPFAMYGGILADSPEVRDALAAEARRVGEGKRVQYIELRNTHPDQCVGAIPIDRYVTFTQPVSPMTDDQLLATVHKKTRNMVRKSLKSPFATRVAGSLDSFYQLMCENYRRLGTPIFPKRFFELLARNYGPSVEVREIEVEGKVAAAALNFLYRGSMHTYYAASSFALRELSPNNYMYFDFLRWAGNNGYTVFDFGRSKKDSGTFEFKRHWGTTLAELPYEVMLIGRADPPNFSPKNPKFEMAIRVWRKLPLPVANFLGPRLIRLFP